MLGLRRLLAAIVAVTVVGLSSPLSSTLASCAVFAWEDLVREGPLDRRSVVLIGMVTGFESPRRAALRTDVLFHGLAPRTLSLHAIEEGYNVLDTVQLGAPHLVLAFPSADGTFEVHCQRPLPLERREEIAEWMELAERPRVYNAMLLEPSVTNPNVADQRSRNVLLAVTVAVAVGIATTVVWRAGGRRRSAGRSGFVRTASKRSTQRNA